MSGWADLRRRRRPTEFELLLRSTIERNKSRNSQQDEMENPGFMASYISEGTDGPDYNFQCGCYGTEHDVVNNCQTCGRVICALEGERPCPSCGSIVLSEGTIAGGDSAIESRTREIQTLIDKMHWVPEAERKSNNMNDQHDAFDGDWFDAELLHCFED